MLLHCKIANRFWELGCKYKTSIINNGKGRVTAKAQLYEMTGKSCEIYFFDLVVST